MHVFIAFRPASCRPGRMGDRSARRRPFAEVAGARLRQRRSSPGRKRDSDP